MPERGLSSLPRLVDRESPNDRRSSLPCSPAWRWASGFSPSAMPGVPPISPRIPPPAPTATSCTSPSSARSDATASEPRWTVSGLGRWIPSRRRPVSDWMTNWWRSVCRGDLFPGVRLDAVAQRDHGDQGSRADDHAEGGKEGAKRVGGEGTESDGERVSNHSGTTSEHSKVFHMATTMISVNLRVRGQLRTQTNGGQRWQDDP